MELTAKFKSRINGKNACQKYRKSRLIQFESLNLITGTTQRISEQSSHINGKTKPDVREKLLPR